MNLCQSAFKIGGLLVQLIGHQQHVALGHGILGGSPGVLILSQGAAKAVLADLIRDQVCIVQINLLHLGLQAAVCPLGHGIGKLGQGQGVVPGKEARSLQQLCLVGGKVIFILLVTGGAEHFRSHPEALLNVIVIIVGAGAAFLAFVHPVDGFLGLAKISPDLVGFLLELAGIAGIKDLVDPGAYGCAGPVHGGAGRAGAVEEAILGIRVRALVKAGPLGAGNLVEGAAVLAHHLVQEVKLILDFAKDIGQVLVIGYPSREYHLSLGKMIRMGLIGQQQFCCCDSPGGGVLAIVASIIPASGDIHLIALLVQLVSEVNLSFLVLGVTHLHLQPGDIVINGAAAAGKGI